MSTGTGECDKSFGFVPTISTHCMCVQDGQGCALTFNTTSPSKIEDVEARSRLTNRIRACLRFNIGGSVLEKPGHCVNMIWIILRLNLKINEEMMFSWVMRKPYLHWDHQRALTALRERHKGLICITRVTCTRLTHVMLHADLDKCDRLASRAEAVFWSR